MNSFEIPVEPRLWVAAALCILISITAFISSTLTGNFSFVDREWSISPILYAWILSGSLQGIFNPRATALAIFITFWGARLTFNFWRRGGYRKGEQDYRWPILQKIITNPIAWHTFNLTFISFYQNILLLLISLPVYVASLSTKPWNVQDSILMASCYILLIGEFIADQQQWDFQTEKYRLIKLAGGDISKIAFPYRFGFRSTGLFRWSRHPNFFCEVMQWIVVACITITPNIEMGYWFYSFLGSFLLSTLFMGSTKFTEDITITKYPLYKLYQKNTSALVPFYAPLLTPSLDTVMENELITASASRQQEINWLASILTSAAADKKKQ